MLHQFIFETRHEWNVTRGHNISCFLAPHYQHYQYDGVKTCQDGTTHDPFIHNFQL
jgi:hypothetical protein